MGNAPHSLHIGPRKMPALAQALSLHARRAADDSAAHVHQLFKRKKNFAAREPGVILVFCIVGTIALLLVGLFIHKKLAARRARTQS
ncbi:uncharacterized protein J3D65DRAFT_664747 [Phyllosticta citribraziliensis]|uniref:Uncharacterized protein n=1 Tax=Phyllosticta citribraziliensis TaxID=989973 RepID=A0ABR1M5X4_9PEZI